MIQSINLSAVRKVVTLRQMATGAITPVSNFFSLILGEPVSNRKTIAVFNILLGLFLAAFVTTDTWYIGVVGLALMAYSSHILREG